MAWSRQLAALSLFSHLCSIPVALGEPLNNYHEHFPAPLNLIVGKDHELQPEEVVFHNARNLVSSKSSNLRQSKMRQTQEEHQLLSTATDRKMWLTARYYFLQALGKSSLNACQQPEPNFTATCPFGRAFIVRQSSKSPWNSRLDCTSINEHSIYCKPKTKQDSTSVHDDNNGITIGCYGYDEEDLQVSVEVEGGTYFCDKALSFTTQPPSVTSGGTVYQTVAIQQQCLSNGGQTEDWRFVEPTCSSLDGERSESNADNNVPTLQMSTLNIEYENLIKSGSTESKTETMTITHCELEVGCTSEFICDPKCAGKTYCYTDMPGFISSSTSMSGVSDACEPRDFSLDIPTGEPCEFNLMCASDICIEGVCRDDLLEDLQACEESGDCSSGACGIHPLDQSATMDSTTQLSTSVCCPSGDIFGDQGKSYCTASQPSGTYCHDDEMCGSSICVFNVCQESLQDDGMECEESSDCAQGVCALYQGTQLCCPTGKSTFHPSGNICSNRPEGDVCENSANSLCASNVCIEGICQASPQEILQVCDNHGDCSNAACALETLDNSTTGAISSSSYFVCCPSGGYVFLSQSQDQNGDALRVCTGQPSGASCSDNDVDTMCNNGICDAGHCQDSPCANIAAICQSGICSDGVCQ